MAVELVEHPQLLLMRQPGAIIIHPRHTGLGVYFLRIVRDIGIGEESPDREGEAAIVHRRVFGIRLQPLARVAKMFAKDKSFRLRLLRRTGNAGDMLQVIPRPAAFAQHMHHVQTPAVHAPWRLQPVAYDTVFTGMNLVDQAGRPIVELRQTGITQPVVRLPLL